MRKFGHVKVPLWSREEISRSRILSNNLTKIFHKQFIIGGGKIEYYTFLIQNEHILLACKYMAPTIGLYTLQCVWRIYYTLCSV